MEDHSVIVNLMKFSYLPEVVDELSVGILFFDTRLCVAYVNSFAARLFDEKPQALIGCSARELTTRRFGSTAGRQMTRNLINVLRTGESYTESRRELLGQPGFFIDQQMRRLDGPDGKPLGVLMIINDITDYVQAEQALRQSEERFRIVADFSYDWEYWQDPSGRFVYVSPSVEYITGYPAAMFIENPKLYFDIMHPQDRDIFMQHTSEFHGKPPRHCLDFRIIRRDGIERWIGHLCQDVFAADGTPLGVRGTNRDITERKETEDELRESRQILCMAEKSGNVGSWRWDISSGKIWWSLQTYEIYGVSPEGFDGRWQTWVSFIDHRDRNRVEAEATETITRHLPELHTEFRVIRADGTVRWVEVRGLVDYDSTGKAVEMVGVNIDITQRRQAEEQLERSAKMEAEARVIAQRQSKLLQEALLPRISYVPEGYRVAVQYVPGTPELDIGGDFYDLGIAENGQIAVLIGDVSGKGVEAASLASSARATARAFAYKIASPGDVLTHTNAVLFSQKIERQDYFHHYVTMSLVVIDPETGKLNYSSAGHPPLVIRKASGQVDLLELVQLPIGIEPDTEYSESESRLNPGDKIVFYTDGITEAHQSGKDLFEVKGIEKTLKLYGDRESEVIVENLITSATSWAGGSLRDDAVVVVVERLLVN